MFEAFSIGATSGMLQQQNAANYAAGSLLTYDANSTSGVDLSGYARLFPTSAAQAFTEKPFIKEKPKTMTQKLKAYFERHEEVFFTLAIVALVDHFIFDGAMRKKIQEVVEKLLEGCHKKLSSGDKD